MKVLVVIGTYLPGYNAGGPVRSIKNLVDFLGEEYDFKILAGDRDLGDKEPYSGITVGEWNTVQKAEVYYVPPGGFTEDVILNAAAGADYIYVCGCFNDYARKVLWMHKRGKLKIPVIIAAMGLFSPGAFQIKKAKKLVYMKALKFLGMIKDITWSATSHEEVEEIKSVAGKAAVCKIAADLPRKIENELVPLAKTSGQIRIVFLSRITLKKNLSYALDIVKSLKGEIVFDIYGPIQDEKYWKECKGKMQHMPDNIVCQYKGEVHTDDAMKIFSQYHFMLFPTRGENYGHVIAEAMAAGCVPVISDKTPWKELDKRQAGFVVKLEDMEKFTQVMQSLTDMGEEYQKYRMGAYKMAKELNGTEENLQMYRDMFQ